MSQPRIYSYVRFSSERQLKGDSLRRQNELIDRYTKRKGYELDSEFRYVDLGVSAFRGQNLKEGKFRHFIEAIREKRVPPGSVLLVESLDRLTRMTPMQALAVFAEIINAGVKIVTLSDGIEHSSDSPENEQFAKLLISVTALCLAHEESSKKSKRLKAAWVKKRQDIKTRPYTKRLPRWLTLAADGVQPIIDEQKATVVQRMFKLYLAGQHAEGIAKIFRDERVPLVAGGKRWKHSYVSQTLRNEAVTGSFTPHRIEGGKRVPAGEPIRGYYPQIVSPKDFNRVQFIMDSRTQNKGGRNGGQGSNIFKKHMFCGYCGGAVHVNYKGNYRSGEPRKTLVCSNAKDDGGCHYITWDYWEFETAFLKAASELHLLLKGKFQGAGLREDIQQHAGRLTQIEKQIRRYQEMLEADDAGAPQPKVVLRRLRELEAEQEELAEKRARAEAKLSAGLDGPQPLVDLAKLAKLMDKPASRVIVSDLIAQIVDRVDIFPAGSKVHYARLVRMHKQQVKKRGNSDGAVAAYLRDHFDRRKFRFFQVHLSLPGVGKRLSFNSSGRQVMEARLDLVDDLPEDADFA